MKTYYTKKDWNTPIKSKRDWNKITNHNRQKEKMLWRQYFYWKLIVGIRPKEKEDLKNYKICEWLDEHQTFEFKKDLQTIS